MDISKIKAFEKAAGNVKVVYGGDGSLVGNWREYTAGKKGKCLLPVRNYGLCEKHAKLYEDFFSETAPEESRHDLKMFLFPVLRADFSLEPRQEAFPMSTLEALSEFIVTGKDPTAAIRFNIHLNGKLALENVIANGVIFSTKLGSTGYFKSVSRTIFTSGLGIGIICPTYSVPNMVVKETDRIEFELVRKAALQLTADKVYQDINADEGYKITVSSASRNVAVLGYDHFMCKDCRKNRNSTIVNDSFVIS